MTHHAANLRFEKKTAQYDQAAQPQKDSIVWASSLLDGMSNEKQILEIGSGTGNWTQVLRNKTKGNITISDVSKTILEAAKNKIGAQVMKSLILDAWDADELSKWENKYDLITSANVLQWANYYNEKNPLLFSQLLKPNGRMIHCFPIQGTLKKCYELIPEIMPFQWKTKEEWLDIFKTHNFSIRKQETFNQSYSYPDLKSLLRTIHNTGATISNSKKINLYPLLKKHRNPIQENWSFLYLDVIKTE
jgi:ubiquinone/menaquinone biosynthesis C-methylase UbiE